MHDHHGHGHDHSHGHEHGPDHGHSHPEAGERKLVPQQAAVLDIGGDVGALLVQTGPDLEGAEIELYDERGGYVMHTEVHGREVSGSTRYAGLFPTVLEGTYLLEVGDGSPRERVTVTGGQVATVQQPVRS
jgi:hypothetical protein